MELVIGGVSISLLIPPIITMFTKYIRPLSREQIEIAKGVLAVLGYILVLLVTENPQYERFVTMALTFVSVFLASTGVYVLGTEQFPSLKSNRSDQPHFTDLEGDYGDGYNKS